MLRARGERVGLRGPKRLGSRRWERDLGPEAGGCDPPPLIFSCPIQTPRHAFRGIIPAIPRLSCSLLLQLGRAKAWVSWQGCILFTWDGEQPALLPALARCAEWRLAAFPVLLPVSALSGGVAKAPSSHGLGPGRPGTECQVVLAWISESLAWPVPAAERVVWEPGSVPGWNLKSS